jgi:hypothetical protein
MEGVRAFIYIYSDVKLRAMSIVYASYAYGGCARGLDFSNLK